MTSDPENTTTDSPPKESENDSAQHDVETSAAQAIPDGDTPQTTGDEETSMPPEDPLAAALAEAAQWKDQALRQRAELENFRKRMSRETAEIRRYAAAALIEDLLPVLDNFDFGLQAALQQGADNAIATGMNMVRRQLDDFLATNGVREITGQGETFNPAIHEAVATETSDQSPEGAILRVNRKGYQLHDRVLRAPQVVVSSGPADESNRPDSSNSPDN